MKRFSLLLLALAGCGSEASSGLVTLPAGIEIRGLQASEVSAVQLTVLKNGSSFFCGDLVKSCLNEQIEVGTDTVPVRDADGEDHNALRVSNLQAEELLGAGVSFSLSVPVGTDYMVVAEVLSADSRLLASGCFAVCTVVEGDGNSPLVVTTQPVSPTPACDPRID